MNDRDVVVYLSPSDIGRVRAVLEKHASLAGSYDEEKAAYDLSDRLREALDEYRDAVRQSEGRRIRPR